MRPNVKSILVIYINCFADEKCKLYLTMSIKYVKNLLINNKIDRWEACSRTNLTNKLKNYLD